MKLLLLFILPISLFAQSKQYPDTIYNSNDIRYPCLITYLDQNKVKVIHNNTHKVLAFSIINKIILDEQGEVYKKESGFVFEIDQLQNLINERNPLYNSETHFPPQAQSDSVKDISFRVESGWGYGTIADDESEFLSLGIVILKGDLGAIIKHTFHLDGKKGNERGFLLSDRPQEEFHDTSLMIAYAPKYGKKSRSRIAAGIGLFTSKQLTADKNDLKATKEVPCLAWEIAITSAENLFGITFSLIGNLNNVSSHYGALISLSFGT